MAGLTLDAGALIAAERADRRFWAIWKEAEQRDVDVTVPTPVIAQVYRGARNAVLARLLRACVIEVFDEVRARKAGLLCRDSHTRDIVDASVVVSAAQRGDDILTSDARELTLLENHIAGCGRIIRI